MNLSYNWYKYNLNVICDKCSKPIPFQAVEGNPVCEECGTISDRTWTDAVVFSNITKLNEYDDGSTNFMGFMSIEMNYNKVDAVNCYHCHHVVETPTDTVLTEIDCANCNQKLSFVNINQEELKNLVFYFHKNEKTNPKGSIIAVRCASCGAPLEADTTKNEYTCNFCQTLNIVPPSLRAKKVLDDVYVGWNGKL